VLENGKISVRQFIILVIMITIGDSILVLPTIPALHAKQDAWISGMIALAAGLPIVFMLGTFGKLYPGVTLVQCNEKILGKWFGTAASVLFLFYCVINTAIMVREIGDFMTTQIMPETPIQSIHILFLGIMIIAVRLGLETFARAGEIFFPWFILLFLTLALFLSPQVEIKKMLPIYEEGIKPIIQGSLTFISFPFMELAAFLMVTPYVNQVKERRRGLMIGAVLGWLVLITVMFLCILVLGDDFTARNIYPSYSLAKKISVGRFIERIEAILAIMWILTTFFKTTLYFYAVNLGMAQLLKLKEYRMLTLPSAMLIAVLTLVVSPNITYYSWVVERYWTYFDITFCVLLPLTLLGVYPFRKKILER